MEYYNNTSFYVLSVGAAATKRTRKWSSRCQIRKWNPTIDNNDIGLITNDSDVPNNGTDRGGQFECVGHCGAQFCGGSDSRTEEPTKKAACVKYSIQI
jgi:hypothetical protein